MNRHGPLFGHVVNS